MYLSGAGVGLEWGWGKGTEAGKAKGLDSKFNARKEMAAVHFFAIPCKPYTANRE